MRLETNARLGGNSTYWPVAELFVLTMFSTSALPLTRYHLICTCIWLSGAVYKMYFYCFIDLFSSGCLESFFFFNHLKDTAQQSPEN